MTLIDSATQRVLATAPFVHDTTYDRYSADFHNVVEWEQKAYRFNFADCPFATIDGPEETTAGGAEISNLNVTGFDMNVIDLQTFVERAVAYAMTADGETRYEIVF